MTRGYWLSHRLCATHAVAAMHFSFRDRLLGARLALILVSAARRRKKLYIRFPPFHERVQTCIYSFLPKFFPILVDEKQLEWMPRR